MSEYIPKYPSQEGDDSNKSSSELLAETLKPIYVPQDLMLAWESHLAGYSRDTHVLLDQVKDSESALNTQYQALLARVQKYEQMLQDITMDSNEFTMDTDGVNFTGWNILAQSSYWDYLLRKEITKLRDQIKSAEFKGSLVSEVSDSVLENLSKGNGHISNIIGALTDSPLIRDLDEALSGTSTSLSTLRKEHERLKAKQYADAVALAEQNGETFDHLTLTFNDLISEQIDKITEESTTRTRVFQELEDGITEESQLRHVGQETIASHVWALKASTDTAIAGIKKEYTTIAGTNEAITTALTTYTAEVDENIATILTKYVSHATLDSALVSKSDELLAVVKDNIAKLNITNEIQAGLKSIKALSTVSVDLNGVVSGYGLISELENGIVKSAFGVNADTFYVGKPTDAVKPFVVTTVPTNIDGIDFPAGTWINSAIIANATIGTAHIADAAITNAKIKELDASKITTGTLEAKRIRVGGTTKFDIGFAPTDVLSNAKTYTDTKTKTFTAQPTTPYASGDIYRNGSSIYVCTTARASGSYVAADWVHVGDVTANNTAADANKLGGTAAATVLDNAAKGIAVYNDVMSDLKITPVEKTAINQEWGRIQKEYASLVAQATSLNVSTATLTAAYNGLRTAAPAMSTILASMSTTTTLTAAQRDAYKVQYTTYYTQSADMVKAINEKIASNAKADLDNLEVGGRNYIVTTRAGKFVGNSTEPVKSTSYSIDGNVIDITSNPGDLVGFVVNLQGNEGKMKLSLQSNATSIAAYYTFADSPRKNTLLNKSGNRFELDLEVPVGCTRLDIGVSQFPYSVPHQLINLKLEKGNKASDWTPAPEDVDAAIQAKTKTFVSTPTVPYSVGDLWRDVNTVKVCTNARATGAYTASDWTLAGDITSLNTSADTAKVNGTAAATVATNAAAGKAMSDDILSDLIITPVEKTGLYNEWNRIKAEYSNLSVQASTYSVATTDLTAAYNALNTTAVAVPTVLATMTANSTFTSAQRDAFRAKFNTYYVAATALSKSIEVAISDKAQTAIDNISIGGVNVLTNSEEERTSLAATNKEYLLYERSKALKDFYDENLGKLITISFEMKVPIAGKARVYSSNDSAHNWSVSTSDLIANTWNKVVLTVAPQKHSSASTLPHSTLEFHGIYGSGRIPTVRKVKVESGNKATAWTASPAEINSAIASKSKTFITTPTTPYTSGDIFRNASAIYVCTNPRATGNYVASDWTLVGDVTANNTSADTAKVNGTSAATVALNAANGATVYADVMSDLKITPVEKTAINQEWNRIQKEYTSLLAQAKALSLTTTPYTSAYTGLSTTAPAMSTILASMSTTTTLTAAQRDAYKSQYTTYYTQAVAITKAINDKIAANAKAQADAKSKTFTAQPVTPYTAGDLWKDGTTIRVCTVTRASGSYIAADWTLVGDVTGSNTSANSLQLGGTAAATVLANANAGKTLSDNVMSDLIITPVEKSGLLNEWNRIKSEYANLKAQAVALGVFATALTTAYNNLNGVAPRIETDILASMITNYTLTVATRNSFKTKLNAYFVQAMAMSKALTDKVQANAAAAQSTATTADDQLTLWKYPDTIYMDGGQIYANSITSNQIQVDDLSAISANLGSFETTNANGTMTISGPKIEIKYPNGIVGVYIGL